MKRISKYIILAALAVIPSILGGSSAKATAESDGAKTPYVIYHDNNGTVISRDAYRSGYTFDAAFPQFYTGPEYMNTGWNTKADGKGTTYKTGEKLSVLTEDLELYPMLEKGLYVRFESNGGTPIQYQFVLPGEKATKPTDPTRTGYTFDNWYSDEGCTVAYDFNTLVAVDMKLYAKWMPKGNVEYKIRIWCENPNHPNRTQSTIEQSDFNFVKTIIKKGSVGGEVSFTSEDISTAAIQSLINSNTSPDNFQLYFYDNENNSYALYLSQESIKNVNQAGGIRADGNTIVDIYFRCMYFNAILTDGGCLNGTVHSYNFNQRMNENIENAISRANIVVDFEPFNTLIHKSITEESYYNRTRLYNGSYDPSQPDARRYYTISDEGALLSNALNPISVYNNMTNKAIVVNNSTIVWDIYKVEKGNARFSRIAYYETIESAIEGRETVRKQQKDFTNADPNNFGASDVYTLLRPDGQECEKFGLGNYAGFTSYFQQIINTEKQKGESGYYASGEYPYGGQKAVVDGIPKEYAGIDYYLPEPYLLEHYLLRNKYTLSFITYSDKRVVAPIEIVYYDKLVKFKDNVAYFEGGAQFPFIVGETTYSDDQSVIWIFKGWYDNEQLLGDPIDFATTTRTMPASNLTLYAKWEKLNIEATFDGNGGKVEGKDKVKKEQQSGDIPKRPADPVPPEGMAFSCWTINGIPYDFTEPIYDNTELKALYYSKGKALKVTYDYGNGAGTIPVDSRKYLAGANPEILSPAADLVPPIGQKFSYWTDSEHHTYVPGDDFIINDDTQLTAVYAEGDRIIIQKEGLKFGESAVFSVYDESEPAKVVNVILTGVDNTGSTVSQIVAVEFKTKNITVKELPWSWAYDANKDVITKDVSKDGNVFTFKNVEKEKAPLRDEAIKNNAIINARYGVTVNEWEKEKRNLGK